MKKYKIVGGPKEIIVNKGDFDEAYRLFEEIINREIKDGWEYHSMENIAITQKPGCFQQPVTLYSYMLIFVKDVKDEK